MASEQVKSKIRPEQFDEYLLLMDDYGSTHELYIPLSASATRASVITAALAAMDAKQAEMVTYAQAHNIDISDLLAAGAAAKAKARGQ